MKTHIEDIRKDGVELRNQIAQLVNTLNREHALKVKWGSISFQEWESGTYSTDVNFTFEEVVPHQSINEALF